MTSHPEPLPFWVRVWTPSRVAWALAPVFLALGVWSWWPPGPPPPPVGIGPERALDALQREGALYGGALEALDWSPNRKGEATMLFGEPPSPDLWPAVAVGEDALPPSFPLGPSVLPPESPMPPSGFPFGARSSTHRGLSSVIVVGRWGGALSAVQAVATAAEEQARAESMARWALAVYVGEGFRPAADQWIAGTRVTGCAADEDGTLYVPFAGWARAHGRPVTVDRLRATAWASGRGGRVGVTLGSTYLRVGEHWVETPGLVALRDGEWLVPLEALVRW